MHPKEVYLNLKEVSDAYRAGNLDRTRELIHRYAHFCHRDEFNRWAGGYPDLIVPGLLEFVETHRPRRKP